MRLKHFLSVFLTLLTLSVGQMWGDETLVYTLNYYKTGTGTQSSYTGTTDFTGDDITWNVPGNQTTNPPRIGANSSTALSNTERRIYSKTAISDNISKVIIEHGSSSNITVNSFTFAVFESASDAQNNTNAISSLSRDFKANDTIIFHRPSNTSWAGRYYRITYTLTGAKSQTNYFQFKNAKFYKEDAPTCDKEVTLTQSVTNGTATFTPAGPVATCSATAADRQVSLTITPTTGYALTSGPTVSGVASATISGSGPYTIQLPQNGNGTLTLNATCTAIAVTGVSLNKNSTSIVEGSTETLTATISPSNALDKAVTWSSNTPGVATVSSSGVVTAVAAGNATITVTTHDGSFSASCTVTVTALPKDHFIDEVQSSSVADKTSSYNFSSVTIADKSVATSGNCEQQHYHFVGWITKAKYDAGTPISDSDIQTGNKTPNNSTYYAVWAKGTDNSSSKDYTLTLTKDSVPSAYAGSWSARYAAEVGGTGKLSVSLSGTNIMQNSTSGIQFKASSGEIHNTADLGSITGISITGDAAVVYAIGTSVKPSSGTSGGYFKIYNSSSNAKYASQIVISFTKTTGSVTYSDYIAKCCTQLGSINGSFS